MYVCMYVLLNKHQFFEHTNKVLLRTTYLENKIAEIQLNKTRFRHAIR